MTILTDVKIDSLGRIVTGKTPSKNIAEYFNGKFQFVTPSDLNFKHYYCRTTETTVTESAQEKHKNQFIPAGSIMFTCIGNTIGKCAIASDYCLTNQQINSVIPHNQDESKFIYYFLNYYMEVFRGIGLSGGVATPIINKTDFSKVVLKAPDKLFWPEIGNLLSKYDDLIENNRRRIQLLEESARLLYQEWFVHLRFPSHEQVKITDGVPEGWFQSSVGELSSYLSRGITPQYDEDGEFVVINQKCVRNRILSLEPARNQSKEFGAEKEVRLGDILINSTGTGTLGRVAQVWDVLEKTCVDTHVTIVRPCDEIPYLWLGYSLLGMEKRLEDMGEGATNQKELKRQYISAVQLLKPPHSLMKLFHETVCDNTRQIQNLIKTNKSLVEARDLLLSKLMSGELTV